MCLSSLVIIRALFPFAHRSTASNDGSPPRAQTTSFFPNYRPTTDHRPSRASRRGARPLSPRAPTTDAPIERPTTARATARALLADVVVVAPSS